MVKVDITKSQLRLLSRCILSPDNLKADHFKQITPKTSAALNKGYRLSKKCKGEKS